MSDEKLTAPDQPDLAPPLAPAPPENSTPPENENGASDIPVQTSVLEKIESATRGLFERGGVLWKKGRGRPRNTGEPGRADVPVNLPLSAVPVGAAAPLSDPGRPADSIVVRRSVAAMAKALTGFLDKKLFRRAELATGDKEFARSLVNETTATAQECDALAEVTDIVLQELGLQTKYLPLVAACTIVGGATMRYQAAFHYLDQKLAEKRRQQMPQGK
jgi:hypothetical protein